MTIDLAHLPRPWLALLWLTGPIFDKELRISSRKKRNYVLRFAYIATLSLLIVSTWYITLRVGGTGTAAFKASRIPEIGKRVITSLVWFQFIAAQAIAAIMLSTSISTEIQQRTLGVLMTTPVNSLQIVMGKLFSKLLQLVLLLAISLPLLAIVRVFGGVPWDYLISSLCITAAAVIFAGSLSLLLSIRYRRGYNTVGTIFAVYLIAFAGGPLLLRLLAESPLISQKTSESLMYLTNPFAALAMNTYSMLSVRVAVRAFFSWPLHCLIMLSAAALMLLLSVWRVRKVALGQVCGATPAAVQTKTNLLRKSSEVFEPIKRITGSAIIWKELRRPLSKRRRARILFLCLAAAVVSASALSFLVLPSGPYYFILLHYLTWGLSTFIMVRLAAQSATSIAAEKDSRTWPILLATPLEDKQIIWGKAVGVFRKNLALLLLLLPLYGCFFLSFPTSDPRYILYFALLPVGLAGIVFCIIGMGLYFGVRLRTTTAAVAATVGIYIAARFFCCGSFNPLPRFLLIMTSQYVTTSSTMQTWLALLIGTLIPVSIYVGIGLLFGWRAKCRLRRNVF